MYHSEETSYGGDYWTCHIWSSKACGFNVCVLVYDFVSWILGVYVLCRFFFWLVLFLGER